MVNDRAATLLVQAAVEGVLDFSQAQPFDPKWHRRVQLTLNALERANDRKLKELLLRRTELAVYMGNYEGDGRKEMADRADTLYYGIEETFYPNEQDARDDAEKSAIRSDISAWEAQFGAMDDEKTKKKLTAFAAAMEKLREDTAQQQSESANSQLGYMGRELGLNPGKG